MSALFVLCVLSGAPQLDGPPGSQAKSVELKPVDTATATLPADRSELEIYGDGGPALDLPTVKPESIDAPPVASATAQQKAYLLREGERQAHAGKVMLYIGIPVGILGTMLGVGGIVSLSNGQSPSGSAFAILSGMFLGAAGGGGILAGSILLHRGRKKMEAGQPRPGLSRHSGRQLQLSFRF